jgi:hypothetical protein
MSNSIPEGFTEALAPELFKFERKGTRLEGILMKAQTETIKGDDGVPKKVLELYFANGRKVVRYRPGYDVKSKMNSGMIGKHVIIDYIGDDESKGKDGNAMKVFGVYFKDADDYDDPNDPGITDDDIPF